MTQRPIKFRAWSKGSKFMYQNVIMADGVPCVSLRDTNAGFEAKPMFHAIPMAFTGLKDKNGKEIYEGDIVKAERCSGAEQYGEHIGEIVWVAPKFGIKIWAGIVDFLPHFAEVIGNIYENPELLK